MAAQHLSEAETAQDILRSVGKELEQHSNLGAILLYLAVQHDPTRGTVRWSA
jgi:hypothetical protein